MADLQEPVFETMENLLSDKTLKISMLAGIWGVIWDGEPKKMVTGVKEDLINYWTGEAKKGRTIEELARYNDSSLG